jgi:CheY-like chemotaxis protein
VIVRVLAVDDYQPWLRFVPSILQEVPEVQILAEATDGGEAVQKALQLQSDLILLDIGLPTLNGIEAARRIREHNPQAKILFVSEQRSNAFFRWLAISRLNRSVTCFDGSRLSIVFPVLSSPAPHWLRCRCLRVPNGSWGVLSEVPQCTQMLDRRISACTYPPLHWVVCFLTRYSIFGGLIPWRG